MKIVFDPELSVVKHIDENREPNRQEKYWHRSGKPFVLTEKNIVQKIEEVVEKLESSPESFEDDEWENQDFEDVDLESLRTLYEEKFGKTVSNRYKNDIDFISKKILE